jgi:hypothetical protein
MALAKKTPGERVSRRFLSYIFPALGQTFTYPYVGQGHQQFLASLSGGPMIPRPHDSGGGAEMYRRPDHPVLVSMAQRLL